jgi:acetyl-CoA carboxylase biotin carboxyl carrier protein
VDLSKNEELSYLETLLNLMARHGLSELEIEGEGRRVRLRKPEPQPVLQTVSAPLSSSPAAAGSSSAAGLAAGGPPAAAPGNIREVKSPMVGTFYRASSPEADPFVREGDRVEEATVLCIIEAMKVMNEITAGIAGVVKEILVKNGESVEFGQPLCRISTE